MTQLQVVQYNFETNERQLIGNPTSENSNQRPVETLIKQLKACAQKQTLYGRGCLISGSAFGCLSQYKSQSPDRWGSKAKPNVGVHLTPMLQTDALSSRGEKKTQRKDRIILFEEMV